MHNLQQGGNAHTGVDEGVDVLGIGIDSTLGVCSEGEMIIMQ